MAPSGSWAGGCSLRWRAVPSGCPRDSAEGESRAGCSCPSCQTRGPGAQGVIHIGGCHTPATRLVFTCVPTFNPRGSSLIRNGREWGADRFRSVCGGRAGLWAQLRLSPGPHRRGHRDPSGVKDTQHQCRPGAGRLCFSSRPVGAPSPTPAPVFPRRAAYIPAPLPTERSVPWRWTNEAWRLTRCCCCSPAGTCTWWVWGGCPCPRGCSLQEKRPMGTTF